MDHVLLAGTTATAGGENAIFAFCTAMSLVMKVVVAVSTNRHDIVTELSEVFTWQ
jgi:hypothetical protein